MHFQLEIYYYSNEANKNKYKNVQTSKYFVAWACCCLKVYL